MIPAALKPYAYGAAVAAWIGSLVAVGWWQRTDGATAERDAWLTRENAALVRAAEEIDRLHAAARRAERATGEAIAAISANYQQELRHAEDQRNRDRAAVRAGTLRLRDPAAPALRACVGAAAEPAAGAGERDGRAPGELSDAAAEFLLDLALDADDTARQLAACQRVIAEDRRMGLR